MFSSKKEGTKHQDITKDSSPSSFATPLSLEKIQAISSPKSNQEIIGENLGKMAFTKPQNENINTSLSDKESANQAKSSQEGVGNILKRMEGGKTSNIDRTPITQDEKDKIWEQIVNGDKAKKAFWNDNSLANDIDHYMLYKEQNPDGEASSTQSMSSSGGVEVPDDKNRERYPTHTKITIDSEGLTTLHSSRRAYKYEVRTQKLDAPRIQLNQKESDQDPDQTLSQETQPKKKRPRREIFQGEETLRLDISKISDHSSDGSSNDIYTNINDEMLKKAKRCFSMIKGQTNEQDKKDRLVAQYINELLYKYMSESKSNGGRGIKGVRISTVFIDDQRPTNIPSDPQKAMESVLGLLQRYSQNEGTNSQFKFYNDLFQSQLEKNPLHNQQDTSNATVTGTDPYTVTSAGTVSNDLDTFLASLSNKTHVLETNTKKKLTNIPPQRQRYRAIAPKLHRSSQE